jgi:hypothetical protein
MSKFPTRKPLHLFAIFPQRIREEECGIERETTRSRFNRANVDCSLSYLSLDARAVWKSLSKSGGTRAKIGIYGRVAKRAKVIVPLRDNRSHGASSRSVEDTLVLSLIRWAHYTLPRRHCIWRYVRLVLPLVPSDLLLFDRGSFERSSLASTRAHLQSYAADVSPDWRSEKCLPRLFERDRNIWDAGPEISRIFDWDVTGLVCSNRCDCLFFTDWFCWKHRFIICIFVQYILYFRFF